MAATSASDRIIVGEVTAATGLKGEVRIRSHTRPAEEILQFDEWLLCRGSTSKSDSRKGWVRSEWSDDSATVRYQLQSGGRRGRHLIVKLEGVDDRNLAELLVGQTIEVERASLPDTRDGEFYWDDLTGLKVVDQHDESFGIVDHLLETGANDVLVVKHSDTGTEILIPWIPAVIVTVDLESRRITVDWDSDY